jgi:hypothetical protein
VALAHIEVVCGYVFDYHFLFVLDAQNLNRQYFPVFRPASWSQDIDFRISSGIAEMVTVGCPSFPEVTEGVLLKEGFVTSLEMETKLSEMRDNMSVMEYRMESWLIRIRDLDTAEMSHMQENMSIMQQQRALDRAEISNLQQQMSNLQQQRTLDRSEMRAEMRAQMRAFTAELRSGFRNS